MAEAARELNDPDWALELLSFSMSSTMGKEKGVDSTHVWQDVVRVLTKAGRLEEAANVLRVRVRLKVFGGFFLLLSVLMFTSSVP